MGSSWFVKPETVRLDLPEGQWIEVKRRLTVGEERKAMAGLIAEVRPDGRVTPNMDMLGKAEAMSYLVDWSLRKEDGSPIRIDTDAKMGAAIDLLDPDKFKIISEAITAHIDAMKKALEQEKNESATVSAATS